MKHLNISTKKYPNTFALIDYDDYKWVSKYKWYVIQSSFYKYARRAVWKEGKQYIIWLHREIMNVENNLDVDHINHDGLDNRKENLRICTRSQNMMNQRVYKNNKSGYKGVYWHKANSYWVSQIRKNKKSIYLGYFKDKTVAAKAYNKAALEIFGKYALLNEV